MGKKSCDIGIEEFKKIVCSSELYFELIQEKTEKDISRNDIENLINSFQNCSVHIANKMLTVDRLVKPFLYWYYGIINKINGKVLGKR